MSHSPSDPQDKVLYGARSAEACKLRQWMTSWGRNYTSAMGENLGAAFQSCWLTHRPHPASCFLTPGMICQCMCGKFPRSGCISTKPLRSWDWKKQPNNLRGSRQWSSTPCHTSVLLQLLLIHTKVVQLFLPRVQPQLPSRSLCAFPSYRLNVANLCLSHSQIYIPILILRVVSYLAGEEERQLRHGEINMQVSMTPISTGFDSKAGAEE